MDIMRANVSDYIAAGNNAARQTSNIQAAAIQSGPDYSKIAKEAQNQKIKTEIEARKAAAGVVKAGMEGKARLNVVKASIPKKTKNSALRKAGAIAAAGALIGTNVYLQRREKEDEKRFDRRPSSDQPAPSPNQTSYDSADIDAEILDLENKLEAAAANLTKKTEPKQQPSPTSSLPINLSSPEIQATLDTISFAEGTWDDVNKKRLYNIAFGGGTFDNTKPHPGTLIHGDKVSSSAHGAYQFMPDTWQGSNNNSNPVMSPSLQDASAVYLMENRGFNPYGDFASEAPKLAPEWASFPTEHGVSKYTLNDGTPQPSKAFEDLNRFRNQRIDFYLRNR